MVNLIPIRPGDDGYIQMYHHTKPFEHYYIPEPNSGCWLWLGSYNNNGYGRCGNTLAHRESYIRNFGEIPENMHVCHKCDTPSCVNPSHLFLGTDQTNSDDKLRKGRQAKGNTLPWAKLSDDDIRSIRESPESQRVIANKYGVVQPLISMIKTRKIWKHIT